MTATFPWFELVTDDVLAQAAALAALVGGESSGTEAFSVVSQDGRALLGVLRAGEAGGDSHWIAQVHADDVAGTCRRLAFLQGEVLVEPTAVEGVGTTALAVDPAGAALMISDRARDAGLFALLAAPRADLGVRTYRSLLDWREDAAVAGPQGRLVLLKARTRRVAAAWETEAVGVQWLPCLPTDAARFAEAAARTLLLDPVDLPRVGRVLVERTPAGPPLGWLLQA